MENTMDVQELIKSKDRIENYLVQNFEFDSPFIASFFNFDKCSQEMHQVIDFLLNKVNFIYGSDLSKDNPFELLAWFVTGERTLGFSDLSDADFEVINRIIELSDNPIIKGRLLDICGIKEKSKEKKLLAAQKYIDYVKGALFQGGNHSLYCAFTRASYLYGKNDIRKFWETLDIFISGIKYKDNDQKTVFFYYITKILQNLNKEIQSSYIPEIENVVSEIHEINDPALCIMRYLICYFKKKKMIEKLKFWRNKYADLCIEIDKKYPHCYNYLKDAIAILDEVDDAEKINEIRFLLEDSYKRTYSQMNMVEHPIDKTIEKQIIACRNSIEKHFNELPNTTTKFLFFINNFTPVSKEEFEKHRKTVENSFFNCVNNLMFDENRTIVYESTRASESETEEYLMSECLLQHFSITASIFFSVWQKNRIIDNELKNAIKNITDSNLLIPNDRREIVYDILIDGLTNDAYKTCVFDLLAQFENGCRLYLKNNCNLYPIISKGGQTVKIDLNHILVQKGKKENKFRNKLVELIGSDLTTNIEYLTCRKLSGNLRNNNYHSGYGDTATYSINEIALFYMILKAYLMGCE